MLLKHMENNNNNDNELLSSSQFYIKKNKTKSFYFAGELISAITCKSCIKTFDSYMKTMGEQKVPLVFIVGFFSKKVIFLILSKRQNQKIDTQKCHFFYSSYCSFFFFLGSRKTEMVGYYCDSTSIFSTKVQWYHINFHVTSRIRKNKYL